MKAKANWIATPKEHLHYNLFWLGQNLLWGFAGYLTNYLTDLGMDAALVATAILAPKIWDAINDILFGYIVDRNTFKNGQKFLPWVRVGVAFVGICVILLFSIPEGISLPWQLVWFIGFYVIFDALYTVLDAPAFSLATVMTNDVQEKNEFIAGNKLWSMVGGTAAYLIVMFLQRKIAWNLIGLILCGAGTALMVPILFSAKERRTPTAAEQEEKYTIKQMFKYLKSNNMLLICLIAFLAFGLTAVETLMSLYLVNLCFVGFEIFGTIMAAVTAMSVIVFSIVIPNLTKKYDKFYILLICLAISTILSVIAIFVGYSIPILSVVFIALKCVGLAAWQVIIYMLVADCVEYGQYKSGTRSAGLTFSLQTCVSKLKAALNNSLMLFCLAAIGFVSGVDAIQPEGIGDRVWDLYLLLPVIGYVIGGLLLFFFYKLRDPDVQVMTKYNNGQISYEEACEKLEKKFGRPALVNKEVVTKEVE